MSRCSWNSDGQQCKFPGVYSHGLNGAGPWRCAWHFSLQGTMDDQMTGSQIVLKSWEWDGSPEQYTQWRNAKYDTQGDKAAVRSPEDSHKNYPPRPGMEADPQFAHSIAELGAAILARHTETLEQLEPGSNG